MGKKDNKWIWIVGALVGGYMLAPKEVKEKVGSTIGTVTEYIPFNLPTPADVTGGVSGMLGLPSMPAMPDLKLPTEADVQKVIDDLLSGIPSVIPPTTSLPTDLPLPQLPQGPILPTEPPPGFNEGWGMDDLRQKAAVLPALGGGGLFAWLTRWFPKLGTRALTGAATRLVPTLGAKAGTRAIAAAIPYAGWAYLAADVGVTVWELISGRNIAGPWLGWGEMFNPDRDAQAQEIPAQIEGQAGVSSATPASSVNDMIMGVINPKERPSISLPTEPTVGHTSYTARELELFEAAGR